VDRVAFDGCEGGVKLLYDFPMCLLAFPLINDSPVDDGDGIISAGASVFKTKGPTLLGLDTARD
jgi:hypothetical protein